MSVRKMPSLSKSPNNKIEKQKKILVTGGAGYIGSVLVPMLLDEGYRVKVVDALIYGQKTPVANLKNPHYQFCRGDLTQDAVLSSALSDADAIIHLAALVGEGICRENPGLSYKINTDLVEKINCKREHKPIIFLSTTSIYGETEGKVCDEKSDPGPYLPYALNKLGAEKVLLKSRRFVILRPATAFGCSPRPRLDLLPNDFTFRALKNRYLDLYNPDIFRTFIYVKDLARIILTVLENFDKCSNEIYNAGTNELNFSKRQLARAIKSKIDYKLNIIKDFNDPDKRNFVVNYDKIKSAIDFEPEYDLKSGISELIRQYRHLKDHPSHYNHSNALKTDLIKQ